MSCTTYWPSPMGRPRSAVISARVARFGEPVSAPGRSTSAMPGCSSVAVASVRLGTNWSSRVPRSASAIAYSRRISAASPVPIAASNFPAASASSWVALGGAMCRSGRRRALPLRTTRAAGCSPGVSSCLHDERGRRDRLPAQVGPRRGDDGTDRQRAPRRAAAGRRWRPGPRTRPRRSAAGAARAGLPATRRGRAMPPQPRRTRAARGQPRRGPPPAPPGSPASRRCARSRTGARRGSGPPASARRAGARRCVARRASATPARSRWTYASRTRSRCWRAAPMARSSGGTGRRSRGGTCGTELPARSTASTRKL